MPRRVYLDYQHLTDERQYPVDPHWLDGALVRVRVVDGQGLCLELPQQPRCPHCGGTGEVRGEGL